MDGLSTSYQDLLSGSYNCVDRIVLNAYFPMGHNPGGFRWWWRALTGSDDTLHNVYLMRMAGRFSRRVRAYAKAHGIPVIDCSMGERKHDLAEQYLSKTQVARGLFVILVGRARVPGRTLAPTITSSTEFPMPYVNHYSFHILDPDWGHITIKMSGHPPFPAQVMLNGHEYVACQARKAEINFTKEANCFTHISNPTGLAKIADTLSQPGTIGRLRRLCERWIYTTCLCFALDLEEQRRSGFRTSTRNYQLEYSRNLLFEIGGHMGPVFQALIDRSRVLLDIKTIKTIVGYKHRPKYRPRKNKRAQWKVAVERPVYDLTIFKLQCGQLTLKIYTKGDACFALKPWPIIPRSCDLGVHWKTSRQIVALKGILQRFMEALSCIDQCYIADEMLDRLPASSQVGKTRVGGIDLNKPRMRLVAQAVVALSPRPVDSPPPNWPPGPGVR